MSAPIFAPVAPRSLTSILATPSSGAIALAVEMAAGAAITARVTRRAGSLERAGVPQKLILAAIERECAAANAARYAWRDRLAALKAAAVERFQAYVAAAHCAVRRALSAVSRPVAADSAAADPQWWSKRPRAHAGATDPVMLACALVAASNAPSS